jgi:hypothetical protein
LFVQTSPPVVIHRLGEADDGFTGVVTDASDRG